MGGGSGYYTGKELAKRITKCFLRNKNTGRVGKLETELACSARDGEEPFGYLLHTMEIATRETMKTTPAAADPAIRGSCSLSSDLKSSARRRDRKKQQKLGSGMAEEARLRVYNI